MTAINSHVVRIIGGDCLALDPDLLVIYLGNNEVVGPYGPGTVFESFSSSLTLIRMSAWAKATRTGQLVAAIAASSWRGADGPAEWAGLSMFRERKISEDDPRLERTYGHMRRKCRGSDRGSPRPRRTRIALDRGYEPGCSSPVLLA